MLAERSEARDRPKCLAVVMAAALVATPTPLWAAPASGEASEAVEPEAAEPEAVEPEAVEPEAAEPEAAEPEAVEPEAVEVEVEGEAPSTGTSSMGALVDENDPNSKRAQSDLEGESLDTGAKVPERLPKLQTAGWWLLFGGVAVATAGGVLAGIAEAREDDAERLAHAFDLTTGTTLYGNVADDYEKTLREGVAFQNAARGLIVAGAAVVLGGVGFFIADGVARKRSGGKQARMRVQPHAGGLAVRF